MSLADWDQVQSGHAEQVVSDPEALFLCAAMWNADTVMISRLCRQLSVADLECAAYARIFECLMEVTETGGPHDPATVLATLHRQGAVGQRDSPLRRALADIATAGASASSVLHYADIVLSQSYRRSYHRAGVRIQQVAEECAEDDLFEHLLGVGRAQRIAHNRLLAFRAGDWALP